ncbi:helix-turn-helix transcriptional regulator [Celeribacter sp.]|uniref:helix-turn-helix transcriptional regulator n=1 Tax=Celeribacter sp. TaxID=1890673 RepID=UPI003A900D48
MEHLKEYLAREKIGQSEFAVRVEISRGALCDILSGRRDPSFEVAMRIEMETGGAVRLEGWRRFEVLRERKTFDGGEMGAV